MPFLIPHILSIKITGDVKQKSLYKLKILLQLGKKPKAIVKWRYSVKYFGQQKENKFQDRIRNQKLTRPKFSAKIM